MPDPRHAKRAELFQQLFACTFIAENLATSLLSTTGTIKEILLNLDKLDARIKLVAPERPLSEINKIDLAILRMVVFESEHKQTPKKVLLDEAIELAKEFGSENSPRFINGALAKLLLDESSKK